MYIKYSAVFAAVLIIMLGGCGDSLVSPKDFSGESGEGGGGGGLSMIVPGSGGKTIADLNLDQTLNSVPCACVGECVDVSVCGRKYGMRIAALTQVDVNKEEITTQQTLGLWEDGKFRIVGFGTGFNGGFQNAGFVDALILYYDQPFEEEFKISARIRINRTGGVSTSKGVHVGAYSNMDREPEEEDGKWIPAWGANQFSKGLGMFFRAESAPQFRMYYSDAPGTSTTAGTGPMLPALLDLQLRKEYIYEVARVKINASEPYSVDNARYTFQLLDSKTYLPVVWTTANPPQPVPMPSLNLNATHHPVGNTFVQKHESLKGKVYAGVCLPGTVAEVSQVKIWTSTDNGGNGMAWTYGVWDADRNLIGPGFGDEPIFSTPDTIPAYVPANYIALPKEDDEGTVTESRGTVLPTKRSKLVDSENVFIFDNRGIGTQWGGLVMQGYTITIIPAVDPGFAHEEIHFELFPMETLHKAFTDTANGNRARIAGSGGGQELRDGDGALVNETFKEWKISFNPDDIESGETVSARFKLVARDLELDRDHMDDPDYSQLQTLPEYSFRIQITKP